MKYEEPIMDIILLDDENVDTNDDLTKGSKEGNIPFQSFNIE